MYLVEQSAFYLLVSTFFIGQLFSFYIWIGSLYSALFVVFIALSMFRRNVYEYFLDNFDSLSF